MNLKSKIFGFAAASVLALSMSAGIASADTADWQNVSVNLKSVACSVTIDSANGSFGNWTWNGTKYATSDDATVEFDMNVTPGSPTGKCPVTFKFTGLSNGTNNIGTSHFSAEIEGHSFNPGGETELPLSNVPGPRDYEGSLTLNDVPNYAPGLYSGAVTITTGATQG